MSVVELRRRWIRDEIRAAPAWLLAIALLSAGLVVAQNISPVHAENGEARAAIETMITLAALAAASLLFIQFEQSRRLRDMLLLAALLMVSLVDFPSSALPAMIGTHAVDLGETAHYISRSLVAAAFAAAACAPSGRTVKRGSDKLVLGLVAAGFVASLVLMTQASAKTDSLLSGGELPGHTGPLFNIVCAAVLGLTAIKFFYRGPYPEPERSLLSVAAVLLAGAWLQNLTVQSIPSNWVTPGLIFRVLAYGMLMSVAIVQFARTRRESGRAALVAERERIARDLHDGLVQDLAFIAAHSERLASDLGTEHPVTVAARRAIAASRLTIADLAASTAPTTGAALEQIADELARRFEVQVDVRLPADRECDFDPGGREDLVRIAREAIVNAVKHGHAEHVIVELGSKTSNVLLRVSDDGSGIDVANPGGDGAGEGFGVPGMRARAASLGASIVARPSESSGTALEVLVSS